MKLLIPIFLLSLLFASPSCVSYQKCLDKFGDVQSDTITVLDTISIAVPGDTIRASFHDSVRYVYEETDRTRLEVRRDSVYTYITCESKTDTVQKVVEKTVVQNHHHYEDKAVTPWWTWMLAGACLGLIILLILKIR